MEIKIFKLVFPCLPPPPAASLPPQKFKFFIYRAILLKFEIEHFHVFTNNDLV